MSFEMQGNKRQRDSADTQNYVIYKPSLPLHMLPPTVDWRGSDADSVIKDQAMCGSCWSFAAVSPLETAVYRQYGALPFLQIRTVNLLICRCAEHNCYRCVCSLTVFFRASPCMAPAAPSQPSRPSKLQCSASTVRNSSRTKSQSTRKSRPWSCVAPAGLSQQSRPSELW